MKLQDHQFKIDDRFATSYDISLTYLKSTLEKHRTEDDLDLCPDFQRGRVWTVEQQVLFCEFIIKGGKCPPLLFNHPGWLTGGNGQMVCVDGLQRITALEALLDNQLKIFGHYLFDYEDWQPQLSRKYLQLKIHCLQNRSQILNWYLQVNATGTPHSIPELDRVRQMLVQNQT